MLIESVGGSPTASRLAGIQSRRFIWMVYVFAAVCAGIAGLIFSSNVSSADGNNAGNLIELDAILAVVIGGTSLNGGRFSIAAAYWGRSSSSPWTSRSTPSGFPARRPCCSRRSW